MMAPLGSSAVTVNVAEPLVPDVKAVLVRLIESILATSPPSVTGMTIVPPAVIYDDALPSESSTPPLFGPLLPLHAVTSKVSV